MARLIGHRGAARVAPENTLAGFRAAAACGVRMVEFDVRLTRDLIPIVLHDDRIDRTTDGQGDAARMTYAEIRRHDAGSWFDPRFRGERVPSFSETLALLGELGLGAIVELKPASGQEAETAERVVETLRQEWPENLPSPTLSSFRSDALEVAQRVAPDLARAVLVKKVPSDWQTRADALEAVALHVDHRYLKSSEAASIRDAGFGLFAYTVNEPDRAEELFNWGVEAVFTDCPDRLLASVAS